MRLFFLPAVILLLISNEQRAQFVSDSSLSFTTDSVIVYSSRYSLPFSEVPFTVNLIENNKLDNVANPLSLEEAISGRPGLFVNGRTNPSQGDRLVLRGVGTRAQFGIRGVKIFLDGIPLTFTDGQAQLNNLNLQDLESAEILMGPSSVMFGNALGGAILLKSKVNKQKKFLVSSAFNLGSYGLKKYSLKSSYNFNDKNNISVSAYRLDSKGFREHSDAQSYGVNLLSSMTISEKLSLNFVGNYFNAPYLLNPSTLNKQEAGQNPESVRNSVLIFASSKKISQLQNGIGLEYSFSRNSAFKTTIYSALRKLDNAIPGRIIDLNRNFAGIRTELNQQFSLLNIPLGILIGIDYEFQFDERKEYKNEGVADISGLDPSRIFNELNYGEKLIDQDEDLTSLGVFFHLNFEPIETLKLFAGIRYDDFLFKVKERNNEQGNEPVQEISMNNFSFTFGFNQKVRKDITLYGNISSGFQTPTTNELSNNPSGSGFNNQLRPELVYNYEIGLKSWFKDLDLFGQLSFYRMDFTNMLVGYQSASEEIFYRNAGKAGNTGLEIQLEIYPLKYIKYFISYTFMNFKFSDYILTDEINGSAMNFQLDGNYLPGIPQNSFSSYIEYSGVKNLLSRITVIYSDEYFTNDFNGPPGINDNNDDYINDSYFRLDFISSYILDLFNTKFKFGLGVENILDTRYNGSIVPNAFGNNFFEPAPGRSYYLNFVLSL